MSDLQVMVGQARCFFASKYEGTLSNLTFTAARNISMVGVASGENIVGVAIEKPTVSFERPALKDSTRQISDIDLDGPINIDIVIGDQTWQLVSFFRSNRNFTNNPDAGTSNNSYQGSATKLRRIK
jgi:hypothetical protein